LIYGQSGSQKMAGFCKKYDDGKALWIYPNFDLCHWDSVNRSRWTPF